MPPRPRQQAPEALPQGGRLALPRAAAPGWKRLPLCLCEPSRNKARSQMKPLPGPLGWPLLTSGVVLSILQRRENKFAGT